jgi:hypothetical protein
LCFRFTLLLIHFVALFHFAFVPLFGFVLLCICSPLLLGATLSLLCHFAFVLTICCVVPLWVMQDPGDSRPGLQPEVRSENERRILRHHVCPQRVRKGEPCQLFTESCQLFT